MRILCIVTWAALRIRAIADDRGPDRTYSVFQESSLLIEVDMVICPTPMPHPGSAALMRYCVRGVLHAHIGAISALCRVAAVGRVQYIPYYILITVVIQ